VIGYGRLMAGVVVLLCCCLPLSGCWDRKELQERNFVLAVAIDVADAGLKPGQGPAAKQTETFTQPQGSKKYRLSLQLLRLATGGGDKAKSKTYVISDTGQSMHEMIRDMLGQSSKSLYFEHIQTIIISEAAVKEEGLAPIIDLFLRDSELRSRIKIYLTSGQARTLLEYVPPDKEPGGIFLANISRQHYRNIHVAGIRTDLGYTAQFLDNNTDVMMSRIELAEGIVKLKGMALFRKDKFSGYVDEYATAGLKMIRGTEKQAVVTIACPEHPNHLLVFDLVRHDTRLQAHVVGDTIYFTLDMNMYGSINEMQGCSGEHDTSNPEYIHKVEIALAEEMKRTVLYGKEVSQKLGVDSLGFGAKLKAYQPETWAKVKDDWDNLYPYIPLVVAVNVTIADTGEHE
jgi:spore germination protein KC